MTTSSQANRLTRISLASATCMPIIYYGAQLAAAPFYPGYSFSHQLASMLGTSYSREPWIFNLGLMLTGIAAIVAAYGFYQSFRANTSLLLSAIIALSVACTGYMSLSAGLFPLPDPRHGAGGHLLIFTLITPVLMLIGIWGKNSLRGLQTYLCLTILLLVAIVPLFKGKIVIAGLDGGTIQRLLALATYLPIGVVGFFFFLHQRHQPNSVSRPSDSNSNQKGSTI